MLEPALYLVPTPIGNLDDITLRAIKTLAECDIIACEDTRRTGLLLQMLKIPKKKLESYHDYNESEKAISLSDDIASGKSVALVTDAGTPLLSDPGYRIVHTVIERRLKIVSLPGASALLPAIISSGLPAHNFIFMGFPPQKKGRKTFLEAASKLAFTSVFYESPHRIEKLTGELLILCGGGRRACIAREISKIHEEYLRGSLDELNRLFTSGKTLKGEIVFVLEGVTQSSKDESP